MSSTPTTTTTDPTSPPQTTVSTTTPKPTTTAPSPSQTQQPQRPIKSPPQFHHPSPFQRPTLPSPQTHLNKPTPDPIRYPLASSGRGLLPSSRLIPHPHLQLSSEQLNSGNYPQIPGINNNNNNNSNNQHPFLHPPSSLPPHFSRLSSSSSPVRPILPPSKATPSPYTTPESIIHKDPIEKATDEQVVTVGDRKVRISEGASVYALCRSWLRNGYLEENKLQYEDVLKSLAKPKPLPPPLALPESSPSKRKDRDEETEVDEVEKDENLTAEELLSRHVKRAKKVRARLREERLQRIDRYKNRLSRLLPPVFQD